MGHPHPQRLRSFRVSAPAGFAGPPWERWGWSVARLLGVAREGRYPPGLCQAVRLPARLWWRPATRRGYSRGQGLGSHGCETGASGESVSGRPPCQSRVETSRLRGGAHHARVPYLLRTPAEAYGRSPTDRPRSLQPPDARWGRGHLQSDLCADSHGTPVSALGLWNARQPVVGLSTRTGAGNMATPQGYCGSGLGCGGGDGGVSSHVERACRMIASDWDTSNRPSAFCHECECETNHTTKEHLEAAAEAAMAQAEHEAEWRREEGGEA